MRLLLILLTLSLALFANDSNTCKKCHPIIYSEFQQSMHKKSTIREDKVHNAVWNKHPDKAKGNYKCAKCHTPEEKKADTNQGVTCISCHTIKRIEKHPKVNKNIYETKDKTFYSAQKGMENKKLVFEKKSSWLGLVEETIGSPYHDIDYTHENFYTGEMCMGCHSHKQNAHKFNVCTTDMKGAKNKNSNCITCHMPKVKGSATTIRESKTHAFHGFVGIRNSPKKLAKYIDISYKKQDNGFDIIIHNKASHNLLTHPLRVIQLKTKLKRNGKIKELKTNTFIKVIGTNNKPSMPWLATQIIKDNMIKANEKRVISFNTKLQKGDEIEAILGYYIVNPKAVKKLGLENEKELSEFIPLKDVYLK
jgi:nitrate/TMAO reductase-like tetraheme cytochrome c subunit